MSWDGTTAQNLAGTPPNFGFSAKHKSHVFAAGVNSAPSTLFFCAPFDPEDWTGAGSGNIKIDPDDGDGITAIISYKKTLIIFKGPKKGSIHILSGSSSSDFTVDNFVEGIGSVSQRLTIPFKDDIAFVWSDGSINSLRATEQFGDFREVSLSLPINRGFLNKDLTFNSLIKAQAVDDVSSGYILFSLPINGSSDNSVVLMMDYRFQTLTTPPRWGLWTDFNDASCIASVIDPTDSDKRIVMAGHQDGFVRKWSRVNRNFDGETAINMVVTLPFLNYGRSSFMKTLSGGSLSLAVKNAGDIQFGWTRDTNTQQSIPINQGGQSDVLAPAPSGQFTLGTSKLAGSSFSEIFSALGEEGGEFRAIQFEVSNSVFNEDVEVHGIGAFVEIAAESTEN